MKKIVSNYLKRIKERTTDSLKKESSVSQVIQQILHVDCPPEMIKIQNGIFYTAKLPTLMATEIKMKKTKIIKELSNNNIYLRDII